MSLILVKGGKIATPDSVIFADILIGNDGKIAGIGRFSAKGKKVIDASGLLVLPGAIDAHVHFRDPGDTAKEDFSTGSASALAGGVTTVMDMPEYRNPATTTIAAYNAKRRMVARKARCDYLLRFGATETNFRAAAQSGAPSLKVFLAATNSELGCSKRAAIRHFGAFPKDKPVCVHGEDNERIEERKRKYSEHGKIHDKKAAQIACEFALHEAAKLQRRVHICHATTKLEVKMCREYANATYEINPAHLYLSEDDLFDLGLLGKINPPLRDRREQASLWRAIGDDTIMASDHAPHPIAHKLAGAPGFPGVGTLLPLMLQAVHEKKISVERLARICSFNPARAFNLQGRKGALAVGCDADIVLVDMRKKWRITAKNRLSKCGWTPFEGKEVYGKIEKVLLRGKVVYDGEKVVARKGQGKELA